MREFILSNGVKIPSIGYGTWRTPDGQTCVDGVVEAIKAGYGHIDTAARYENEQSVGEGIRKSGVKREDVFVTSKLWNTEHTYDKTIKAFEKSLSDLGLDYLDLYLVHWPIPLAYKDCWQESNNETWRAFEKLYKDGKVRAIGVSNFKEHHLKPLMENASIMPMVNQIECNPGFMQTETREFCAKHNILIEGWAPFKVTAAFEHKQVKEVAEKYGKTEAQVLLRFYLQQNILPLPKSVTPERIRSNMDVFDFELEKADIDYINQVTVDTTGYRDPDNLEF